MSDYEDGYGLVLIWLKYNDDDDLAYERCSKGTEKMKVFFV